VTAPLEFPSKEWCRAAAAALHSDPAVRAAVADFGPVAAGVVVQRGPGLASDFCVLARIEGDGPPGLSFPDDEDELEELGPDYVAWVPVELCRELLREALAGRSPDPLQLVLARRIRVQGDLQRLVRAAGRHAATGVAALRTVPTSL
jgi:hypothetical protein